MTLTQQQADWLECHHAYINHMRIEAADRGYDFRAGADAQARYTSLCVRYEQEHGEEFWPSLELASELMAVRRAA